MEVRLLPVLTIALSALLIVTPIVSTSAVGYEKFDSDCVSNDTSASVFTSLLNWLRDVAPIGTDSPDDIQSKSTNQIQEGERRIQSSSVVPNTTGNALALRERADAALASTNQPRHVRDKLADTEKFYLDSNRVTSAVVFHADTEVAAASRQAAPNATTHLVESDRAIASQAINDAYRVQDELERRNVSYNSTAVTTDLRAAETAFEDADQQATNSTDAIDHYRAAWVNAQRALDRMDAAVKPQVTIADRSDMPHYETRTRTVNGTIFDVRPHELTATADVDGEEQSITLSSSTVPGTAVRFNTTVEIPPQFANDTTVVSVNVSAFDSGINYADHDSETKNTLHGSQTTFNRLVLDGDGLPDEYERTVTKTDPMNPISNSSRSETNESSNDVLDGAEDFDNDDIWTYYEYESGLDPFDNDTDGDCLTDQYESRYSDLDPSVEDNDGDGIPDGEEDFDDDGLTTLKELNLETEPFDDDTDADRLSDGREQELGTDPLTRDTDEDGLTDYEEVELGTYPLATDTDRDGVPDGEELYRSETSNEGIDVSVTVEASGLAETNIGITPKPNYHTDPVTSAGPTVYVTNRTTVESMTVSMPLASDVKRGDDISIYHWGGTSEKPWTPVSTTIYYENRTAVADVPPSGFLTVLDRTEWRRATIAPSYGSVDFDESDGHCVGDCEADGEQFVVGGNNTSSGSLSNERILAATRESVL